jgi:signal peptide peptidase SppA
MKLLDMLMSAWAILPDQLREIQAIYAAHLRGDKIDIEAIEARLGRPLANEQQDYEIRQGGVAVLTLDGIMAPKANLFMRVSGGVSTQMAGLQIESAMADPRVTAMVLAIDSPGGSVFGTPELGATVRDMAAIKPIVTVSEATLASAAYWVGSGSNAVYISGPTVQVGSIGVVASHNYDPAARGVTTEITAGKYKRITSATGPLSEEGKAYMQSQVDHLYQVFVDAVASNRGTTPDSVLEHMADGRVFIGQQAIDRGLVDGVSTVDAMVEHLATNPAKFAKRRKAVFANGGPLLKPAGAQAKANPTEPVLLENSNPETKGSVMDRATLEQQHPALFAQLKAEFSATATASATSSIATATATATAAGAAAERDRIAAVRAQTLPGHEALVESLAFDGKTTGPEAAMAVMAAERARIAGAAAAHAADAPQAAPHSAAPADTKPTAQQMAANAIAAHKAATGA